VLDPTRWIYWSEMTAFTSLPFAIMSVGWIKIQKVSILARVLGMHSKTRLRHCQTSYMLFHSRWTAHMEGKCSAFVKCCFNFALLK
jgi:hypothetical protein